MKSNCYRLNGCVTIFSQKKNVSEAQLQHFIEIVLLPVYTQK